jgi:hypothetical protein
MDSVMEQKYSPSYLVAEKAHPPEKKLLQTMFIYAVQKIRRI